MDTPRKRPEAPRTIPAIPAARPQSDRRPSDPPSSGHHDSNSPPKWEVDKALKVFRETAEQNETLRETVSELSANLEREHKRTAELEENLARFQRRSREDDEDRDRAILEAKRDLRELADRVAKIAAPSLEASGAVGAKVVVDASERSSRRREWIRDIVVGLALAATVLWNLLHDRPAEPTATVPVPTVRPAGTGPFGTP